MYILPRQLLLSDKEAANQRTKHNPNQECEALIRGPAITATHDLRGGRIQGLNEVKTLTDTVDNLIDVFAVAEGKVQAFAEELLNDCGGEGEADDGAEGAEEVGAGCHDGLIFGCGVGDYWGEVSESGCGTDGE